MQLMRGAGLLANFGLLRMDEGKYFLPKDISARRSAF
jgi:hypothetical protein